MNDNNFDFSEVDEVNATDNQKSDEVPTTNNQNGGNKNATIIVFVINTIARCVASLVKSGDGRRIEITMRKILTTLFAMCALGEYDLGLRVKGELYRYDEYQVNPMLAKLLVSRKVVARDVLTATDFLNRKAYADGIDVRNYLEPAEFQLAWKEVCQALRISAGAQGLSRSPFELLTNATGNAVNGKKVPGRDIPTLYFLTQNFDKEATVTLEEWCRSFAYRIAELK